MSSIEERVKKIVSSSWASRRKRSPEASFVDDLGADSLDTVELVMASKRSSRPRSPTRMPRRSPPCSRRSTTSTRTSRPESAASSCRRGRACGRIRVAGAGGRSRARPVRWPSGACHEQASRRGHRAGHRGAGGQHVPTAWDNILDGRSGITPITHFDVAAFSTRFGGDLRTSSRASTCRRRTSRRWTRSSTTGSPPASRPSRTPAWRSTEANAERIGVASAPASAASRGIEKTTTTCSRGGPRKISPFFVPANIINMVSGQPVRSSSASRARTSPSSPPAPPAPTTSASRAHDPVRRRGRDDRRRRRDGRPRRSRSAASSPPAPCPPATTTRPAPAGPGTRTATASCWATAPAWWCWRSTSTPRPAARGSTAELVGFGMNADAYHMTSPPEDGEGCGALHAQCAARCRARPRRHRLHQRPRHLHAARRRGRDPGDQARLRRPRRPDWWSARPSR